MSKSYYSLGLMSGTSMDGVDASIIQTDGKSKYKAILDKYFAYPKNIHNQLIILRNKINSSKDLKKYQAQIKSIERKITIFHAVSVNQILKKNKVNIEFIGFHGQTIFHSAKEKITRQIGDANLLSKLTKKRVVYDFRKNDLKNNGQGAPLAPIFHKLIVKQNKIKTPVIIINLGGIANYTIILKDSETIEDCLFSKDSGPGNCLIDKWVRKNSNNHYDKDGKLAKSGKINKKIVNQALESTVLKSSYDLKDFDISIFEKLSLKDGAATLAEYTASTLVRSLYKFLKKYNSFKKIHILVCGGGRKNNFIIKRIKKKTNIPLKLIDYLGISGDFVESQAFAYLGIRSYLKLPISFPQTTGCKKSCTGGEIVKNF